MDQGDGKHPGCFLHERVIDLGKRQRQRAPCERRGRCPFGGNRFDPGTDDEQRRRRTLIGRLHQE